MVITASGVQMPEIINLAITKAGLNYSENSVLATVPQAGVNEYLVALDGGHTIKATLRPYGYPSIQSIA